MQSKRVMPFILLGVLASVLLLQFASAASPVFDPVKNMFTSWQAGNLSVNIAKYLIWFLVAAVVYSVLAMIPMFKGKGKGPLRFLIAIVVSFLGTAYFTPSDVYTILASYSAMGFVISAILPFVILLFFSIQVGSEGGFGGRILSKVMWFGFVVFLVWKLVDGMFGISTGAQVIDYTEGWIYIAVIVASLIWIFWAEGAAFKWLFKEKLSSAKEELKEEIEMEDTLKRADKKRFKAAVDRIGA